MKEIVQTCIYCAAELGVEAPSSQFDPDGGPIVMDDDEWQCEVALHNPGCPWVETRAHSLDLD